MIRSTKMETSVDQEMDDIEMMDVEDIEVTPMQACNDLPKRKLSSVYEPNYGSVAESVSPKTPPKQEFRAKLKARRALPKSGNNDNESDSRFSLTADESLKPICVLDTNILLSNLTELKSVIIAEERLRQMTTKSKIKSIIIPWIVIQELDKLKHKKVGKSVANVIKFINEQLKRSNGLVRGENTSKMLSPKSKRLVQKVEEVTNDDKIINCCLMSKSLGSSKVIVVSNDVNLCNKALMSDLIAVDWRQFYDKYQSSDLSLLIIDSKPQDIEPKKKRSVKLVDWRDRSSSSRLVSDSSSPHERTKPAKPPKSVQHICKLKNPFKKTIANKNANTSVTESADIGTDSKINTSNDIPLTFEDFIRFRDECEQRLIKFVEWVYRQTWSDEWKQMLEINVNNTNLKELVRLLKKQWIGMFSDHFGRDKSVKAVIDRLHSSLSKSETNYHLYCKDLQQLVEVIQRKHNNGVNQ